MTTTLHFDRRVSPDLLAAVRPGGSLDLLAQRALLEPERLDLQFRRSPGSSVSAATLYVGLTGVLTIEERAGLFRANTHATHKSAGSFDDAWATWQPGAVLAGQDLTAYLSQILAEGAIDPRWFGREGIVQTAICRSGSDMFGVIQREASVASTPPPAILGMRKGLSDVYWAAVAGTGRTDPWWPGVRDGGKRPGMGGETDVLAVDHAGRLLVIEVKPAAEIGKTPWAVAQVSLYAEMFARLLDTNDDASEVLAAMATQRHALGLLHSKWATAIAADAQVVPVLAIGDGTRSPQLLDRVGAIHDALSGSAGSPRVAPLEVWLCGADGLPVEVWRPLDGPRPAAGPAVADDVAHSATALTKTFVQRARASAVAWKSSAEDLPAAARLAAPYGRTGPPLPFVFPTEHRWHNLLNDARKVARSRFDAAGIRWHGDGGGPNPHLCSSQVQCLNALAPLVDDPVSLRTIFGGVLPIAEVLQFGADTESAFDATDHVVFEWQGLEDHLCEWGGGGPVRGAYATSADAAIRYRNHRGDIELALIEWKYTESYPFGGRLTGSAAYHAGRLERYRDVLAGLTSPLRLDLSVDYEDLFAEPIYQLARTQALARRMASAGELGATRGRVVLAASAANVALLRESLGGHRFARFATSHDGLLPETWRALLRDPGDFAFLDTGTLVAPGAPTSEEFKTRYVHLAEASPLPEASHCQRSRVGILPTCWKRSVSCSRSFCESPPRVESSTRCWSDPPGSSPRWTQPHSRLQTLEPRSYTSSHGSSEPGPSPRSSTSRSHDNRGPRLPGLADPGSGRPRGLGRPHPELLAHQRCPTLRSRSAASGAPIEQIVPGAFTTRLSSSPRSGTEYLCREPANSADVAEARLWLALAVDVLTGDLADRHPLFAQRHGHHVARLHLGTEHAPVTHEHADCFVGALG